MRSRKQCFPPKERGRNCKEGEQQKEASREFWGTLGEHSLRMEKTT